MKIIIFNEKHYKTIGKPIFQLRSSQGFLGAFLKDSFRVLDGTLQYPKGIADGCPSVSQTSPKGFLGVSQMIP